MNALQGRLEVLRIDLPIEGGIIKNCYLKMKSMTLWKGNNPEDYYFSGILVKKAL